MNNTFTNHAPNRSDTLFLQWTCRSLSNMEAKLALRLRVKFISALAFSEVALPAYDCGPECVKYTAAALPRFPRGSAAIYLSQQVHQCRGDKSVLQGHYE